MTNETKETENKPIVEYNPTVASLAKMKEDFAIVPDAKDPEGYEQIKTALADVRTVKKNLEDRRKEIKRKLDDKKKWVEDEATRIKKEIDDTVQPWQDARHDQDKAEEKRKEIARKKRQERIDNIKKRLENFNSAIQICVGEKAEYILTNLKATESLDVEDGSFDEYEEDAVIAKQICVEKLTSMYDTAVEIEKTEAKQKADREQLDKEKKEFEEERKIKAEADEKADAKRKEGEDDRIRREKINRVIDSLKEVLTDMVSAKDAKAMRIVRDNFAEQYDDYDFQEFQGAARQQNVALLATIDTMITDKDAEEKKQRLRDEEYAELKADANERARVDKAKADKEFEEKRLKDQEAADKAKREADVKLNKQMRDAAYDYLERVYDEDWNFESLVEELESGRVPHVSVQWTQPEKEKVCDK